MQTFKILCVLYVALQLFGCGESAQQKVSAQIKSPVPKVDYSDKPYFILLSDIHLDTTSDTTDYGKDTGTQLWSIAKTKIAEVIARKPAPQFILYTGDLPGHYSCLPSCFLTPDERGPHNKDLQTILADLQQLVAGTAIPLLYAPGNNDSLAGDYYSFADENLQTPFSLLAAVGSNYPALNAAGQCGTAPCVVSNPEPTLGFYSARPVNGLRVIALNSIIWGHSYNPVDGVSQLDAGNKQMQWLVEQLADVKKAGEKAYIIMHIPPGLDAYHISHGHSHTHMWADLPEAGLTWVNQFLVLTEQYQNEIEGVLYGHTHMDEVRRLYNPKGDRVTEVALSGPGITPQHDNNPAFKIVWFQPDTKALIDFETLYTTPDASAWGNLSYRFSDAFNCGAFNTIYNCLARKDIGVLNLEMDSIFTVMHGAPAHNTQAGIEVKPE